MAHNLQARYSKLTDIKLRATLVTKDNVIFNTRYDGNPTAGAVKIPVRDGEASAGDYSTTSGKALTNGSTAYLNVSINKDKAVNELIDGYEAAAVPDELVADRIDSAGYSLAAQLDSDGLAALVGAETAISDNTDPRNGKSAVVLSFDGSTDAKTLSKSTIFDAFVDAGTKQSEANVPNDGRRWAIVSPAAYAMLLKDTTNFIKKGDLSQEIQMSGALGQINGYNIYQCNRLPDGANITVSNVDYKGVIGFICGHPDYCTRVDEYKVPVKVQDLSQSGTYIGACAVQGRMVYAHCVNKPQAFVICKYKGAAVA